MRIVCLSAEAADICFRLGAEADVVAVCAFAPKQPQKPVVSGFSHGNIEDIVQADPELVITFSDVQARLSENLERFFLPFRHLPVRPFAISPTRPFAFPGLTALYVDRIDLPQ